ncbi:hypothetical protein QBC35DRAFT_504874 [Podospora australis]|uniref:Uncharacterized protein n=1 Tax=Podospora australis TaxID=1536484 RepID=A0AAN6WNJ8_9PEZI|nr:hypothetical protein QBC35DRAFT_504874 [Podospora australis]
MRITYLLLAALAATSQALAAPDAAPVPQDEGGDDDAGFIRTRTRTRTRTPTRTLPRPTTLSSTSFTAPGTPVVTPSPSLTAKPSTTFSTSSTRGFMSEICPPLKCLSMGCQWEDCWWWCKNCPSPNPGLLGSTNITATAAAQAPDSK